MASFYAIMGVLQQQIQAALTTPAIVVAGLTVVPATGVGWPPLKVLQDVARAGTANVPISIYDRKIGRNTTRWLPEVVAQTIVPATLTTALSRAIIPPLTATTITLGATVTPGDAVSALLSYPGKGSAAQVAVGGSSDTPTTLAAALAAQINADTTLNTWVTATAAGPVVTLSNIMSNVTLGLQSYTGNGGTQTMEIARRERSVQITCWSRTQQIREGVVDPINNMIATDELNFGLTMPDGTVARLCYVNDFDIEDDTLEDVYRHDFMVSIEYPVTVLDQLYAVLAPIVGITVENAALGT
jgi:hypothetical protein